MFSHGSTLAQLAGDKKHLPISKDSIGLVIASPSSKSVLSPEKCLKLELSAYFLGVEGECHTLYGGHILLLGQRQGLRNQSTAHTLLLELGTENDEFEK